MTNIKAYNTEFLFFCGLFVSVSHLQPVLRDVRGGEDLASEQTTAQLHTRAHVSRFQIRGESEPAQDILPHISGKHYCINLQMEGYGVVRFGLQCVSLFVCLQDYLKINERF